MNDDLENKGIWELIALVRLLKQKAKFDEDLIQGLLDDKNRLERELLRMEDQYQEITELIHPLYRDNPFALDLLKKFGHEELPGRL
jgi:peptidoglycan hydrolase CwlO-like protein